MARRWDDVPNEGMLQNPLPPTKYGVTDEERAKWNGKQDALEFDDEPTEFSSKMLNSSVVFTALKKVQNTLTSAYKRYVDVVLGDLSNTPAFTKLVSSVNTVHEKVNRIDEKIANYTDPRDKADKHNTVITGSISLGRAENTRVAEHSVALGLQNTASEVAAHAEGEYTQALGRGSHAEGDHTLAQAQYSHAEGGGCRATGDYSHAEGCNSSEEPDTTTRASGMGAHAEGRGTHASNNAAHSEGELTIASGMFSHAEGKRATAVGNASHAEGMETTAFAASSHSEGYRTSAAGDSSHAEGMQTIANSSSQHVQGKFNVVDTTGRYAHIVGGGSSNTARKNIHTVDWQGTAEYAGDVIAQGCDNTGVEPTSLIDVGIRLNNLEGSGSNSVFEEITVEHPDVTQNAHFIFVGTEGTSTIRAITIHEEDDAAAVKHYIYNTHVDVGDVLLFTNAYGDNFVSSMYADVVAVSNGDYQRGRIVQYTTFSEIHAKGYFEVEHPGELWICVRDYDNHPTQLYMRRKKGNTPIVLWSTHAEQYLEDATVGDEVLNSVIAGKQVYVRVPNTDGNKYTAIYSPVYMYQLPNYANSYLYLFYLTDEQQDLNPLLGIPVKIPTYGELKLKLSKEYNQTPLW